MASTLDKLADRFLTSLLHRGELCALPAVQRSEDVSKSHPEGAVRIIRPLLFLREKTFEQFAAAHGLPCRRTVARSGSNTGDRSLGELLQQQEQLNPLVYQNIRNALRPILSLR